MPGHNDWELLQIAPGWAHGHCLGSDAIGQDVFVRTLLAGRVALLLGFGAGLCALVFGLAYGALAGTLGGASERGMMRALDVIPAPLFLLIAVLPLTLFKRSGVQLLVLAVGAYAPVDLAAHAARRGRAPARAAVRAGSARSGESGAVVAADRAHRAEPARLRLAYLSLAIPQAILVESFLSFLGLGPDEPAVSLGGLACRGRAVVRRSRPALLAPATFLALLLIASDFAWRRVARAPRLRGRMSALPLAVRTLTLRQSGGTEPRAR
ncbi:MAG: peptide ABC transporter permease [Xanthomonadales bacterium]|nr:peptide ABC transporter permease [Xanthomonadales bacterium]